MSSAETGKPIAGALVKMTTHNPVEVTKIRDVTRKTASDGLVQDSRFIEENIMITASSTGFDEFTKMINFTCEGDKCTNCVWFEQIELNKAEPNETTCTDASFKIKFTDSVSKEPIYGAIFDLYRLPLDCPLPEEEVATSTLAATPTPIPASPSAPTTATAQSTSTVPSAPGTGSGFFDRMLSLFGGLQENRRENTLIPSRFRFAEERSVFTTLNCNMTQVGLTFKSLFSTSWTLVRLGMISQQTRMARFR